MAHGMVGDSGHVWLSGSTLCSLMVYAADGDGVVDGPDEADQARSYRSKSLSKSLS